MYGKKLMKQTAGLPAIFALAAIAAMLFACQDIFQPIQTGKSGTATVSIAVTDARTRTVLPGVSLSNAASYKLLGGRNGDAETELADFTGAGTTVSLEPGTWNFTLNAYNSGDGLILQGKAEGREITLDGPNNISFNLFTINSGTGAVNITINFPFSAGITRVTVSGDIDAEEFPVTAGGSEFVYAKTGVEAGDYFISIKLFRGTELRCVVSEAVLVRGSLTSSKTVALAEDDIKPELPPPANVRAAAGAYGSITVSWDSAGDNTSYNVYTAESADGTYTLLNDAPITGTTFTHNDLEEGQTGYYKVSIIDSWGFEGQQSSAASAVSWFTLPVYNDLHESGISNDAVHYYRFPVISGTQYRVSWTGDVRVSAYRADGAGTAWFSDSVSSGQERTANITGYMVLKIEGTNGAGQSGVYSIQVTSGTQALNSFVFSLPPEETEYGTINHDAKTIDVVLRFQTSLSSLTPVVSFETEGSVHGVDYTPSGPQSFVNPVTYIFNWSDGSKHAYTVTVTFVGQGNITIIPPEELEDETVGGFTANITVSKNGIGYNPSHTIMAAAGYSSYEWYVDGLRKAADSSGGGRSFTVRAADYSAGRHTITIIVYKNDRPYSNEQGFTVTQ